MSAQHDALVRDILKGMEAKATVKTSAWGTPGTDQVPDIYNVQAHHQMIVSNLEEIIMPVGMCGFSMEPVLYRIKLNPDLRDFIIEQIQKFWRLVETDTPPESVPSPEIAARVIRKAGKRVNLPAQAALWAKEYQEQGAKEREAHKAKEAAKALLQGALVDADEGAFTMEEQHMVFCATKIHIKEHVVKASEQVRFTIGKDKQEKE
jgi:predicted phage-related endonuclease